MSQFKEILTEICAEQGIRIESLSHGYILRLIKAGKLRHIFGPFYDLNSAAADRIACDKYACHTMLKLGGIPVIQSELFFNPLRRPELCVTESTWAMMLRYFKDNGCRIVVKPNQGSQGRDVYYCDNPADLERAVQTIFATEPDVLLSPYHDIETEYRVFYLNSRCHFVYGKTKGGSWMHNLSQGATAFEVTDKILLAKLTDLAKQSAECINISFASVDIAALTDNKLVVMEINSGVQAKFLLEQMPHLRETIKAMYSEAIQMMYER